MHILQRSICCLSTVCPYLWKMLLVALGLTLVFASHAASIRESHYSNKDVINLHDNLLQSYDTRIRPLRNQSEATKVNISLYMMYLHSLEERTQKLSFTAWFFMEWQDEMLEWDSEENNITMILLAATDIWLPDIHIHNSFDRFSGVRCPECLVEVRSDGHVIWGPGDVFHTHCDVDMTSYPFDSQSCNISLSTLVSDSHEVDLSPRYIDLLNYQESVQWKILSTKIHREPKSFGKNDNERVMAHFTLHIARRRGVYITTLLCPVFFFSTLTFVGFILPPESGEKVSVSASIFLSFSFFMGLLNESMPHTTRSSPILGIYIAVIMVIGAASVGLSAFISSLYPWQRKLKEDLDRKMAAHLAVSDGRGSRGTMDPFTSSFFPIEDNRTLRISRLCDRIFLWSSIFVTLSGTITALVLLHI